MDYNKLLSGLKRFGSTEQDICVQGLRVLPEQIKENVVIAPWWNPGTLPDLGEAELLSPPNQSISVWNIKNHNDEMTFIKTGIGAPVFLDALLTLGVTNCKKIVFVGSVGSLDAGIGIGDIVIPEYSVCGDGASRYISSDDLTQDVFGEKVYPDKHLFDKTVRQTSRICEENSVKWHRSRNFSVDTITAQFSHIDTIMDMGCNVIEMETAAAFRAAKLINIPLVALFSVSDNTITNKSLISGRTIEDMEYRQFTRRELFPRIILSIFKEVE